MILNETPQVYAQLLPLTYTRHTSELRIGILTIAEKWALDTGHEPQLTGPQCPEAPPRHNITPCVDGAAPANVLPNGTSINRLYDIFLNNAAEIEADIRRLRPLQAAPSPSVTVIGHPSNLYIDPTATVEGCIINVKNGPVYVGPHAEIMEGATLRGPIAVCEHAVVRMGARIYGGTTIGPWCKVGGEVDNVVMHSYSNKAHDGYLGNAVIGSWCNIGAGAVASNLKNDYSPIKQWNYAAHRFTPTGLQFCGLVMGDYSKVGVNTMLNTATVLGVGVNIHGSGFPRPFVSSFTEWSAAGCRDVPMNQFIETARRQMARRGLTLTDEDVQRLEAVRLIAESYR